MHHVRLLHITPELPPNVGGIADYTAILSRRLVEVSEGSVVPTLIRAGWKGDGPEPDTEFDTVDCAGECDPAILARTIQKHADSADRTVVLLQYSGYGYAQRGAPWWLVRGLQQACGASGIPLITMFHEIRAWDPRPWTSAFWFSLLQTHIARRLAQLSRRIITNHPAGAETVQSFASETPVDVCPVFSNVGEPTSRVPYEQRSPVAILFGGKAMKREVYHEHSSTLNAFVDQWDIDTIIDIGSVVDFPAGAIDVPVDVRGIQPVTEISACMAKARVGLLRYPSAYATKSGILASLMAHGVVPVIFDTSSQEGVLIRSTHFLDIEEAENADPNRKGSMVSKEAAKWYEQNAHSERTASIFLSHMYELTRKSHNSA